MSILRLAGTDDASALTRLEERASTAVSGHLFTGHPYPYDDVLVRWTFVLQDPDVTVVGAWCGERLVGQVAWDARSLRHLAVDPDELGSGLGGRLHDRAVDGWTQAGAGAVELWVLEGNERARRFYAGRGWRPDGRVQECPWPPHPREVGYAAERATLRVR